MPRPTTPLPRQKTFAARLLAWYSKHGRTSLPWQYNPTPYRVWVSEIMLQQTQVSTVIPYFERFMQRFPDVHALARAALDEVLHLWTGLGYYARARNLHRAAGRIVNEYGGEFPRSLEQVIDLPGIGRSTAGAILSLACGQRQVILDGNVKRVLARHAGVAEWPGLAAVEEKLWQLAGERTPRRASRAYTQAIMDLGATLCTPKNPECARCPVRVDCVARSSDAVHRYPAPKPQRQLPVRACRMLLLVNERREVLLQQRPLSGIWGGLWSLPECKVEIAWEQWCRDQLNLVPQKSRALTVARHTFSHFHLDIHPVVARVITPAFRVMEPGQWVWYNTASPDARGLAAPVKRLLETALQGVS